MWENQKQQKLSTDTQFSGDGLSYNAVLGCII